MPLYEILKLLFSKESRQTVGEALKAFRRTPEWKHDLVAIDESFGSLENHQAFVLLAFVHDVLIEKAWEPERVTVVDFICRELTSNAFTHGLKDSKRGKVRLCITLSTNFFRMRISDSGGGFDLKAESRRQYTPSREPRALRGLGYVKLAATQLSQETPNTLVVQIERNQGAVSLVPHGGVDVVVFKGAITFESRQQPLFVDIVDALSEFPSGARFAFDLTAMTRIDSAGLDILMRLIGRVRKANAHAVLICPPDHTIVELLRICGIDILLPMVASRDEAAKRLSSEVEEWGCE